MASADAQDLIELTKNGATWAGLVFLIVRSAFDFLLKVFGTKEVNNQQNTIDGLLERIDNFAGMYHEAVEKMIAKIPPPPSGN